MDLTGLEGIIGSGIKNKRVVSDVALDILVELHEIGSIGLPAGWFDDDIELNCKLMTGDECRNENQLMGVVRAQVANRIQRGYRSDEELFDIIIGVLRIIN